MSDTTPLDPSTPDSGTNDLDAITAQLNTLNTAVSLLQFNLAGLTGSVLTLQTDVTAAVNGNADITTAYESLSGTVGSLVDNVNGLGTTVADHDSRINALESGGGAGSGGDVSALEVKIAEVADMVSHAVAFVECEHEIVPYNSGDNTDFWSHVPAEGLIVKTLSMWPHMSLDIVGTKYTAGKGAQIVTTSSTFPNTSGETTLSIPDNVKYLELTPCRKLSYTPNAIPGAPSPSETSNVAMKLYDSSSIVFLQSDVVGLALYQFCGPSENCFLLKRPTKDITHAIIGPTQPLKLTTSAGLICFAPHAIGVNKDNDTVVDSAHPEWFTEHGQVEILIADTHDLNKKHKIRQYLVHERSGLVTNYSAY